MSHFLGSKKLSINLLNSNLDTDMMSVRSQQSIQSEGFNQKQQDRNSQIFFSFNNGNPMQELSQKNLQDKNNSLKKLRMLQQELKSCKSRSNLWQKAKYQILNLNKFMKLSSISLNCSDSAILKQFFQSIGQLLMGKDEKKTTEKSIVAQAKRKQTDYFEKLVQSKKIRYELEQKIIHYQHEISKLSDINESLRQKSRAQSTDVNSKIRQFHEESLITIQQKDIELTMIQTFNIQLKQQINELQQKVSALQKSQIKKREDLIDAQNLNKQHKLENERLNQKILDLQEDEARYQKTFQQIKQELNKIIQENIGIRVELKKRGELVLTLRNIIQEAKTVNETYWHQLNEYKMLEQIKRQQNIIKLHEKQQLLKKNLKSNVKFGINSKKDTMFKRLKSQGSFKMISSQQLLL